MSKLSSHCFIGLFPILFLYLFTSKSFAQDVYFSQYYQSPLFLNPAFIGMERNFYVGVNHRSQWKSLNDPYETSQVSVINPIYQKKGKDKIHLGGLGMSMVKDVSGENGVLKTYGFNLAGAYYISLNKESTHNLCFSILGGLVYRKITEGNLIWGSQINAQMNNIGYADPGLGAKGSKTYPIINSGVLWYYKPEDRFSYYDYTFFAGFTANNINTPNESFSDLMNTRLPILYKLHAGGEFPINRSVHFSPNILLMRQNNLTQINGGAYLIYNALNTPDDYNSLIFQVGSWYRANDSFIFLAGLTIKSLNINVSYDLNVSSLKRYTGGRGATEIALSYRLIKDKKSVNKSFPF